MSVIETMIKSYEFNRKRTLSVLERAEAMADPREALGWRPGPGRAHVAWQLMHIGITEELFASERLLPDKPGELVELWPRFRGGSTPEDDIPEVATIRQVLEQSRRRLLETLTTFSDSNLSDVPAPLKERGWTLLDVLHVLGWHEAHHQGQAHITLNLYEKRAQ